MSSSSSASSASVSPATGDSLDTVSRHLTSMVNQYGVLLHTGSRPLATSQEGISARASSGHAGMEVIASTDEARMRAAALSITASAEALLNVVAELRVADALAIHNRQKEKDVDKKNKSATLKSNDTPWPSEYQENPLIGVDFEPSSVSQYMLQKTFKGHSMAISAMAIHPRKPIVATVSDDMSWKMWSIPNGELIMSGDGHKDWVSDVDFHPKGSSLATASGDGTVKIWDFMNACCSATFTDHSQAVWGVSYHDSGDFIASCSMDHTAKLWDLATSKCRQSYRGHVDSVNTICWQPFSNNLATGSGDKTVSIWDMRSGLCSQTFYGHKNAVNSVSFNIQVYFLFHGFFI